MAKYQDLKTRLTSRKFLSMIGAVLIAAGSALTGQVEWTHALNVIVGAVIAYIAAEGAVDVVRR